MNRKLLCIPLPLWAVMLTVSLLLFLFPQADLETSALFYTPGEGFLQHYTAWERFFYKSVPVVLVTLYLGGVLLWLYNRFSKKALLHFGGRELVYILLVGAVGSGLIVNVVLKEQWGRARPAQTQHFGGDKHFTPAFVLSDAQGKSFSSGHTSGAFALLALVFLARRRRRAVATAVIAYGAAVSLARIAAGGHFLSDVFVSVFIMYITAAGFYRLMFGCEKEKNGV